MDNDRDIKFDIVIGHHSITPPSFMKFCPVVPEICRGHVHVPKKERRRIIIIIRYDYNLTIMKSPKLANDCFRRHHVEELQTCSPGHARDT
jgi:hypothetical protein